MITFKYTILYVKDIRNTVHFYEETFGFIPKFITPESDYAELNTGSTTLAFAVHSLAKSNLKKGYIESDCEQASFGMEIGIVTDEVAELVAKVIHHGGTIEEELVIKPWGQTVAYVRDLDGFLIEICSPME